MDLPTGTAGRVTCLLSGGIDSPVAAHRMMKRGCAVNFVHFHSYPILSRASIEKARELVRLLTTWQQRSRLYLVAFGDIQQQVVLAIPGPMRVIVYRRLMLRIAEKIARARGAKALVTGDVVGQVASQTLENLQVIGSCRDAAAVPAADRNGQGRNHGGGAAARQLSDFHHSRPGLLHAVHPSQSADARTAGERRSGRARVADRRTGGAGGGRAPSWKSSNSPPLEPPSTSPKTMRRRRAVIRSEARRAARSTGP